MKKYLLIDNYDSFSYMLADYFKRFNLSLHIIRNDEPIEDEYVKKNISAIIISPGPGTPQSAGFCLPMISQYYQTLPIFGVCLGFQAIGEAFGARIDRCEPRHGRASVIKILHNDPLFQDIPDEFSAGRYHSLGVFDAPESLEILAIEPESGLPMAIKTRGYPCYGVQFHPESLLTEKGETLIRNFVQIVTQR